MRVLSRATLVRALAISILGLAVPVSAPAIECGDVNDQNGVTATDALLVLQKAVGQDVTLLCNVCGSTTTSMPTSTTTTTVTSTSTTTSTLPIALQGDYAGNFDGDQTGTVNFNVAADGEVVGNGFDNGGAGWGLAGTATPDGQINFSTDDLLAKDFTGTIDGGAGTASGTWQRGAQPLFNGTWDANQVP